MRGMQELQPEMAKLQAKYKGKEEISSPARRRRRSRRPVQEARLQPVRGVPARDRADADLLRPVPGAVLGSQGGRQQTR
ncbi:hypothetical protein QJS66_14350 [Kocuria rhizophila]|nr:hypothetical protein QJS66_14350 [Kocuria rhizophila]